MCQGIMQHRRELMQIFIGFRARHRKLRPKDIKGRICLVVIEDEQQFVGHRRQFAFATTAWFAPARSGLEPFFIRFLLRCLVDVAEDRQQVVELGLGQAGQGFHLTLVSDLHAHWLASSMAFWRTVYLSLYWGTTLVPSRVINASMTPCKVSGLSMWCGIIIAKHLPVVRVCPTSWVCRVDPDWGGMTAGAVAAPAWAGPEDLPCARRTTLHCRCATRRAGRPRLRQ